MATRANFPSRVKARQESAKVRQEKSDKLNLHEKLQKQDSYKGKEYVRLQMKLREKQ